MVLGFVAAGHSEQGKRPRTDAAMREPRLWRARARKKKSTQQLGLVAMDSCSAAWLRADAVGQRMAGKDQIQNGGEGFRSGTRSSGDLDRRKATAREIWASLLRPSG
jgi:hypothetical protein